MNRVFPEAGLAAAPHTGWRAAAVPPLRRHIAIGHALGAQRARRCCVQVLNQRKASVSDLGRPDGRHLLRWTCRDIRADPARPAEEASMIVTIVTFHLPQPTTLADITTTFQGTAPKYRGIPGLLRKTYFLSEDGRRAGGIYTWESRADADRVYTAEWRAFVEGKYGTPPSIEYLHAPVMVDNTVGKISVAA